MQSYGFIHYLPNYCTLFFRGPAMESLGTGRYGAGIGRKGQEEAFPLPAPVPSDSIAGPPPPKKGKKSLAYPC